jgi:hypothetical protein
MIVFIQNSHWECVSFFDIQIAHEQKCMPENVFWGPVIGQNTVTGHGVLPLTPHEKFIGHTFLNGDSHQF